jgi:hypothetical protein
LIAVTLCPDSDKDDDERSHNPFLIDCLTFGFK